MLLLDFNSSSTGLLTSSLLYAAFWNEKLWEVRFSQFSSALPIASPSLTIQFPNPFALQSEAENLSTKTNICVSVEVIILLSTWTKLGQISWEFEIKVLHLRKAPWKGLVVFCAFHNIYRFICVLYVVESQNMILCTFCHTLWSLWSKLCLTRLSMCACIWWWLKRQY